MGGQEFHVDRKTRNFPSEVLPSAAARSLRTAHLRNCSVRSLRKAFLRGTLAKSCVSKQTFVKFGRLQPSSCKRGAERAGGYPGSERSSVRSSGFDLRLGAFIDMNGTANADQSFSVDFTDTSFASGQLGYPGFAPSLCTTVYPSPC